MSVYEFEVKRNNGKTEKLSAYQGKVLLIVNTASQCGFTKQYEGLENLYKKYRDKGFEVLAFPCNQFGEQEPGDGKAIAEFCTTRFSVTFPLFEKIEVNGVGAHPLYQYLVRAKKGLLGSTKIKWNFTKFLIGKDGVPVKRYAPQTEPESIKDDLEKELGLFQH